MRAKKVLKAPQRGVRLPMHSGTEFLRTIASNADVKRCLPGTKAEFEERYARSLVQLEHNRRSLIDPSHRVAAARDASDQAAIAMRYGYDDDRESSLIEFMASSERPAIALERLEYRNQFAYGTSKRIPYHGHSYTLNELGPLAEQLEVHGEATTAAANALRWISGAADDDKGYSSLLKGVNIVILGGNAELSPAELFLQMGANVLLIDLNEPKALKAKDAAQFTGMLHWAVGGANLLEQPDQIAETIAQFAYKYGPVHLLNLAYAPRENREWRLMGAQNAIARNLPRYQLRSVGMFVSPSVPAPMTDEDFRAAQKAYDGAGMRRLIGRLYPNLTLPNVTLDPEALTLSQQGYRSFAPIANAVEESQGGSYMGAQLVEKIWAAETWLADGHYGDPIMVSANIASITHTRSMDELRYRIGFAGARALGIHIADPEFTANVSGLLWAHDMLNSEYQERLREDASLLWARQVHGGIYREPFALSSMFLWARAAAVPNLPWTLAPKYPR